jgi:hypothetical protein
VSGYANIHRRLLGHPAFRNDAEAMAFAWLVVKASWQPTRVRYKDRLISLERGQLAVSIRDFASAMDRDKAWVERLMKRLRAEAMVKTSDETGVSVVTICNYADYQRSRDTRETVSETPNKTSARQAQDTEQEQEEPKKVSSEAKASSPRAWALPAGLSLQVWDDFKKNRSKKRLPNTETAWKGFLDDLTRVSAETGIPPPKLIERCTAKGWGAIYDPRNERDERPNSMGRHQPDDGLSSTARAAIAVFGR